MSMTRTSAFAVILTLGVSLAAQAAQISIGPSKDNTLIQATNANAQLSNGLGDIFTGRTNQDGQGVATISIRRGLVAFNVAGNIPAGSTITGVTLTMRDVMGLNGDPSVELHRVLADWGQGTSFQSGGMGAAATQDDATWLYRFYQGSALASEPFKWNTACGDFSPTVSAASIISDDLGSGQSFSWSSAGLIADVQFFLDNPGSNFGWLLLGDESRGQSAKRLNSSESTTLPNVPPILQISYVVPEPSSLMLVVAAAVCVMGTRFRRRAA